MQYNTRQTRASETKFSRQQKASPNIDFLQLKQVARFVDFTYMHRAREENYRAPYTNARIIPYRKNTSDLEQV